MRASQAAPLRAEQHEAPRRCRAAWRQVPEVCPTAALEDCSPQKKHVITVKHEAQMSSSEERPSQVHRAHTSTRSHEHHRRWPTTYPVCLVSHTSVWTLTAPRTHSISARSPHAQHGTSAALSPRERRDTAENCVGSSSPGIRLHSASTTPCPTTLPSCTRSWTAGHAKAGEDKAGQLTDRPLEDDSETGARCTASSLKQGCVYSVCIAPKTPLPASATLLSTRLRRPSIKRAFPRSAPPAAAPRPGTAPPPEAAAIPRSRPGALGAPPAEKGPRAPSPPRAGAPPGSATPPPRPRPPGVTAAGRGTTPRPTPPRKPPRGAVPTPPPRPRPADAPPSSAPPAPGPPRSGTRPAGAAPAGAAPAPPPRPTKGRTKAPDWLAKSMLRTSITSSSKSDTS